jgi:hypothetical protein
MVAFFMRWAAGGPAILRKGFDWASSAQVTYRAPGGAANAPHGKAARDIPFTAA